MQQSNSDIPGNDLNQANPNQTGHNNAAPGEGGPSAGKAPKQFNMDFHDIKKP